MAMALPRPSTASMRPAYMDNLFRDAPPLPTTPSLHSSNSSVASALSAFDFKLVSCMPRPLSPALEDPSDTVSVRSMRLNLSPRFRVKNMFHRRTYPQVRETGSTMDLRSQSVVHLPTPSLLSSRRPSLPKLQTGSLSPHRKLSVQAKPLPGKPLPQEPILPAQELSCHRCYYFAARNCNGWVMGGDHGDSCETCLNAGFFGAP